MTPEGDLYPVPPVRRPGAVPPGQRGRGVAAKELQARLAGCHIYTKESCPTCWARYLCSGGCHANADLLNGDIFKPESIGCALTKKRFECGLWLKAQALLDVGD